TDFVGTDGPGGGRFARAADLAAAVRRTWPRTAGGRPFVVCTGGEPLLQLDAALAAALHEAGFGTAIEKEGARRPPPGGEWGGAPGRRLGVRQSQGGGRAGPVQGRRVEARVPPRRGGPRTVRAPRLPLFLPPADGRPAARTQHAAGAGVLPGTPPVALESATT